MLLALGLDIKNIINLTRINRPAGFLLLFLPCLWGVILGAREAEINNFVLITTAALFAGSILMRSAGCVLNDIADREIDKKVFRTKNRPLASKSASVQDAVILLVVLLVPSLFVVLLLSPLAIRLAFISVAFAAVYPFTKRFLKAPQVVLGVAFASGAIVGEASILNKLTSASIVLYIGAIFWVVYYDTIYALCDVADDKKNKTNSTALLYYDKIKGFLFCNVAIFLSCLFVSLNLINASIPAYFIYIIISMTLFCQIKKLDKKNNAQCMSVFNKQVFLGVLIAICLAIS